MKTIIPIPVTAKEVVLAFLEAMNRSDYKEARSYVEEGLKFEGVLGSREGAEVYFKDMQRMRFRYDLQKVWADKEDVGLFYEINMSGTFVPTFGWYNVKEGKIVSIRVLFDPRPVLEQSKNVYENG